MPVEDTNGNLCSLFRLSYNYLASSTKPGATWLPPSCLILKLRQNCLSNRSHRRAQRCRSCNRNRARGILRNWPPKYFSLKIESITIVSSTTSYTSPTIPRLGKLMRSRISDGNMHVTRGTRYSLASVSIIPLFSLLVSITTLTKQANAYITTLDANSEECYFEKAIAGTKLGFTFEVIEGGFLDISISIYDPNGNMIHQEPKTSSGKYTIEADKDGPYKYCFSNKMSTVTPKVVMFSIETARQVQHKLSGSQDQERVKDMVKDLTNAMTSVKHELEYLSVRDRIHRRVNDSTNSRVVVWTWVESLILLAVSFGQVIYIKRFFEVRRAI